MTEVNTISEYIIYSMIMHACVHYLHIQVQYVFFISVKEKKNVLKTCVIDYFLYTICP